MPIYLDRIYLDRLFAELISVAGNGKLILSILAEVRRLSGEISLGVQYVTSCKQCESDNPHHDPLEPAYNNTLSY